MLRAVPFLAVFIGLLIAVNGADAQAPMPTATGSPTVQGGAPTVVSGSPTAVPTSVPPVFVTATSIVPPIVNPTNVPNFALTSIPVFNAPDLTLAVSANPNPAIAGQILQLAITVRNQGNSQSPQTRLLVPLPSGTTGSFDTDCSPVLGMGFVSCPGTSSNGCSVNPATGVADCSGVAFAATCFQQSVTGAITCGGVTLPYGCSINSSVGVVCPGGIQLPAGCTQNGLNGVVTCSGTGFGANCFLNPVNGVVECPTVNLTSGCSAALVATTVDCIVPTLNPGQTAVFTIPVRANVSGGGLSGSATVDPDNFVAESDENNNRVSFTIDAVLGITGGPPSLGSGPLPPPPPVVGAVVEPPADMPVAEAPVPAPPVADLPMPEPPVAVLPPEVPAEVAGAQVPLWLNILVPTDAYSVAMEPLWTAQPGEWYEVRLTEGGWALVIWEYDTAADQQWIELDPRVSATNVDRETPPMLFLQVQDPTWAYGSDMEPLWIAEPGENYAILEVEEGWALALWEHDSPEWQVWIELDPSVAVLLLP